jgi:hypothetical protein
MSKTFHFILGCFTGTVATFILIFVLDTFYAPAKFNTPKPVPSKTFILRV